MTGKDDWKFINEKKIKIYLVWNKILLAATPGILCIIALHKTIFMENIHTRVVFEIDKGKKTRLGEANLCR